MFVNEGRARSVLLLLLLVLLWRSTARARLLRTRTRTGARTRTRTGFLAVVWAPGAGAGAGSTATAATLESGDLDNGFLVVPVLELGVVELADGPLHIILAAELACADITLDVGVDHITGSPEEVLEILPTGAGWKTCHSDAELEATLAATLTLALTPIFALAALTGHLDTDAVPIELIAIASAACVLSVTRIVELDESVGWAGVRLLH